jgi:hypothetical protein
MQTGRKDENGAREESMALGIVGGRRKNLFSEGLHTDVNKLGN